MADFIFQAAIRMALRAPIAMIVVALVDICDKVTRWGRNMTADGPHKTADGPHKTPPRHPS